MDDNSEASSHDDSARDAAPGGANQDGGAQDRKFTIRDADEVNQPKKKRGFLKELLVIVAIVLALMFIFTQFLFRQYVVPSESMEPTLHGCYGCSNDRIVIDKFGYRFGDPEPGDVIVFEGPTESWNATWSSPRSSNPVLHKVQDVLSWFALAPPDENNLVKRVIATGGQTVQCRNEDGKGVTVDGEALDEPYIDKSLQVDTSTASGGVLGGGSCYGEDFGPIKVPDDHVWVMGDNRSNSADSRAHMDDEFQGTIPESEIRGKVRFILYPFSRIGGVDAVNPQG
ncbi:signal peptidase I [Gordonia zhaorongruii]|uniref:signal peptidase I n=1 Tax=Gordonia zhaorongruii TaxID=2597659 RepID=UPI001F47EA9D|nr:signal peptidase I [Gordonia zhaorongruii]